MDRGRSRILTLQVRDLITKQVIKEAHTNAEKGQLLYQVLFPKRTAPPAERTNIIGTQAKWEYTSTTDKQIHKAIKQMKPWKATRSGTIPNVLNREKVMKREKKRNVGD